MIFESRYDILLADKFEVDYDSNILDICNYNVLKRNTSYIRFDTENNSVVIELFYVRDVFKLNKVLKKGSTFNVKYTVFNDDHTIKIIPINGEVIIDDLQFNHSSDNRTLTLYCIYKGSNNE